MYIKLYVRVGILYAAQSQFQETISKNILLYEDKLKLNNHLSKINKPKYKENIMYKRFGANQLLRLRNSIFCFLDVYW